MTSPSPDSQKGRPMPVSPPVSSSTADREIFLRRVISAPRELVFDAFTHPAHVAQWWGPNGFTTQVHEMDVRPGGLWRFLYTGPDGTKYANRVTYREVVRPERLAYLHDSDVDNDPQAFEVTVTFEAQGPKTLVIMHSVFLTAQACQHVKSFGAEELGQQTLAKLDAFVQRPSAR
jgi:uncharacterized protein YndB with AHSA1/START domain